MSLIVSVSFKYDVLKKLNTVKAINLNYLNKMKKFSELDIRVITVIQVTIATIISLLFQFVFPYTWQPLDVRMYGQDVKHGDPNLNVVLANFSQWFFSFSIAWLIYRDNPYINNFLVYSFGTLSMIFLAEIFYYHLYWDFIHVTPLGVDIYILWQKRDTLYQKWLPYYLLFDTVWYYTVYFLHLAYFLIPLGLLVLNWAAVTTVGIALSFTFHDSIERRRLKKAEKKEI